MTDYERANQEAEKIFSALNLTTQISAPIADVKDEWPNILYRVTFSKSAKNLCTEYRLGVGHVKFPKTFEAIPHGCPVDLVMVFNTLRHNPGATLKDKGKHAHAAVFLAIHQKVAPKPYEVFAAICEDSLSAHSESFENWCANFGSDPDSIKARKVYDYCCELFHQISALVNRATISKLAELHSQF